MGGEINGELRIYKNDGSGNISEYEKINLPGRPSSLAVGNFDDNAFPDVAITLEDVNQVFVLINDGGGFSKGSSVSGSYPVGINPNDVAVADLDYDGKSDLVVSNYGSNS